MTTDHALNFDDLTLNYLVEVYYTKGSFFIEVEVRSGYTNVAHFDPHFAGKIKERWRGLAIDATYLYVDSEQPTT